MKSRTLLAAALFGSVTLASGIAATAASDTGAARRAASQFRTAAKALTNHKVAKAITAAEGAVALDPRNASYRVLLGRAYLAAGRFPSAVDALNDALALNPADGDAALNLALAQIATGKWDAARALLSSHEATIPVSDRGLALALAGDPASAVTLLTAAARDASADAKTRQNLALSLALAGRWNEAKTVASLDMAPADVDARIMEWAAFAKPSGAADQVAALLGVVPVVDGGQPVRLALNIGAPAVAAIAQPVAPVETAAVAPVEVADAAAAASEPSVAPAAAPIGSVDLANIASAVVFAERREIAQQIASSRAPVEVKRVRAPATTITAPKKAIKVAVSKAAAVAIAPRPVAKGNFYVQLGAFENAVVAKDAWGRMARRIHSLGSYAPQGMTIKARGQNFYRLSIGGFARGDADAVCGRVRRNGGRCFVRAGAGDQTAAWSAKGVQLAMR